MSETETDLGPLTKSEAKEFIRALEKKVNTIFKGLKAGERVTYNIHSMDEATGRYTYNQVTNKEVIGRVVIGRNAKGKADILNEFSVTRQKLHADLNIGKRLEVKQNEKRWSNR